MFSFPAAHVLSKLLDGKISHLVPRKTQELFDQESFKSCLPFLHVIGIHILVSRSAIPVAEEIFLFLPLSDARI
jgi:hypothetical protein